MHCISLFDTSFFLYLSVFMSLCFPLSLSFSLFFYLSISLCFSPSLFLSLNLSLTVSTSHFFSMVIVLSFGEAIWSPRTYDYTMSIAPEVRTFPLCTPSNCSKFFWRISHSKIYYVKTSFQFNFNPYVFILKSIFI